MERERFVETGEHSFYGEYLYDQIVPQEHFLRKLLQIIDWQRFTRKLIRLYKGEGVLKKGGFLSGETVVGPNLISLCFPFGK